LLGFGGVVIVLKNYSQNSCDLGIKPYE